MILVVVSTGHFDPLIEACNEICNRQEFFGQIGSSNVKPLFPFVRTVSQGKLMELMSEAELVVSHAGTGMLSMLYQLKKKTVIIPKQIRYGESNDGQVELAKKWAELGLATLCMNVNDLEESIQTCLMTDTQIFAPPSLGKHLGTLIFSPYPYCQKLMRGTTMPHMLRDFLYRTFRPIEILTQGLKEDRMLKEGSTAPDFSVMADDGKTVSLKDFSGHTIILWFYPKADTPGCTLEGCGFRDRMTQFEKKNAVVLGVSFDSVEENQKFKKKFGFPFQLLCDTERKIGLAYGACTDTNAKHATRIGYIIGPDGRIKKAFPSVDAKAFPETTLSEV